MVSLIVFLVIVTVTSVKVVTSIDSEADANTCGIVNSSVDCSNDVCNDRYIANDFVKPTLKIDTTEYDQFASLMKNHYEQIIGNNNKSLSARIKLSRKVDSSLVRSQQGDEGDTGNEHDKSRSTKNFSLNIQNLTRILYVDYHRNTVRVQTRCTYETLVLYLLTQKQPMIPLVVPEFKSITIGGAILGGALESSSYLYGQVSDTVQSMTVLLPNGTIVNISEHTHNELYHSIPGSYGSLVILLDATIRIRPIKSDYIQLNLFTYSTIEDGIEAMSSLMTGRNSNITTPMTLQQPEFLDAIQYPDSNRFVIISGIILQQQQQNEQDHPELLIRTEPYSSRWFYEVIYDKTHMHNNVHGNISTTTQIHMPIYDYLFRYERGAFWMARPLQFTLKTVLHNPVLLGPFFLSWKHTRFMFGKWFTATILYRLLHKLDPVAVSEKFLIQDSYIPFDNATHYIHYIRRNIPISVPIWICPVKRPSMTQPLSPSGNFQIDTNSSSTAGNNILMNVGVWGRVEDDNGIHYMQQMEQQMILYNGRKMLYSITSASQMSYETLYKYHIDGPAYTVLRDKYDATNVLQAIHEKLQLLSQQDILKQQQEKPHLRRTKYWLSHLFT